jgi:hypothetical protein
MSEWDIAIRPSRKVGSGAASPSIAKNRAWEVLKRAFSFPALLGALLMAAVFYDGRAFFLDPDVWWHIKVGETVLATHRWPTTDVYSFTLAGQLWISPEWLGEVLLATVSRVGGVRGLDLLLIVLGSAIMLALYALGTIRSGNSKAALVSSALVYVLACPSFTLRPQMLGYLFLIVTLIALELFRQGKKGALWVLPPLFLVWVNTHGSWIIGLGALFVYWACGLREFRLGAIEAKPWSAEERRGFSMVFLLSVVAIMLTPYGTELAVFPFRFALGLPLNSTQIKEWLPLAFSATYGKVFLALIVGFFLAQIAFGLTWRLEELALFSGGTVMACLHARFLLIFVPFFVPVLSVMLARWVPPYSRAKDKYALNLVLMASVFAAMIHYFPSRADLDEKVAKRFPVKAVEYLRQHSVPGPMFDSYAFGGYLIWALGPEKKVFIDGRGELYEPGGVFNDYLQVAELKPGALSVLQRYEIRSCLIAKDEGLATVLAALSDWRKVYSDETSILFVRRDPMPASASLPVRGGQP